MNNIRFKDFQIDEKIIAPEIYSWAKRQISSKWIEISDEINGELSNFLKSYIDFLWLNWKRVFFRIDCYFDEKKLYILDVNASFVDGRWNGLNFTRSVWEKVESILLEPFPNNLYLGEEQYRPEFELFINEWNLLFWEKRFNEKLCLDEPTYFYWTTKQVWENIFPYNWIQNDDKINLARFSKIWTWELVKIPEFILYEEQNDFSKLPENIVLKIANKNNIRPDWRNKVFIWKSKYWKNWQENWKDWILVAQKIQNPSINEWLWKSQAIILTAWAKAVCGYLQNSIKNIINDNSVQSPLIFNK